MKEKLSDLTEDVTRWLPDSEPDGSEVGANYVDAFLKSMSTALPDGVRVSGKRRGLKITVKVGDNSGEALLRRLEHGPDVEGILHAALDEAMRDVGGRILIEDGSIWLER